MPRMFNIFRWGYKTQKKGDSSVKAVDVKPGPTFPARAHKTLCSDTTIPSDFKCPISKSVMVHPVIISCGHIFECAYITEWFQLGHTDCPVCQQELPHNNFISNYSLMEQIKWWADRSGQPLPRVVEVNQHLLQSMEAKLATSSSRSRSGSRGQRLRGQRLQEFREKMVRCYGAEDERSQWSDDQKETKSEVVFSINGQLSSPSPSADEKISRTAPHSPVSVHLSPYRSLMPSPLHPRSTANKSIQIYDIDFNALISRDRRGAALHTEASDDQIKDAIDSSQSDEAGAAEKLRAFSKLSKGSRLKMGELGAVPILVEMLNSNNAAVVENAVTTILNLGLESNLKEHIASEGALKPLSLLAVYAETVATRENAIGALSNLCVMEANRKEVWDLGVVPVFVSVARDSNNQSSRRDALIGLFNLSLSEDIREELLAEFNLVSICLTAMEEGCPDTEEEVALLLYSLSKSPLGCDKILEAEGVVVLGDTLDMCKDRTSVHIIGSLLNIAKHSPDGLRAVDKDVTYLTLCVHADTSEQRSSLKANNLLKMLRELQQRKKVWHSSSHAQ